MRRSILAALLALAMALSLLAMALSLLAAPAAALEPALETSERYAESEWSARLRAVELSGDWHTDLVRVALSQVGYHEGDAREDYGGANSLGSGNFVEYGSVFFGMSGQWCALFVSWCARQAQIPKSAINTAVRAASDGVGGREKYYFHIATKKPAAYDPQPGDLVFFDYVGYGTQHVGIVAALTENGFYTVEGNSLNAVRVMYYDRDERLIKYYGVYTQYAAPEEVPAAPTVEAVQLDFLCRDGARGQYPDSDDVYSFTTLWALPETTFSVPENAFVRDDATLAGYYVRRCGDGAWYCADGKWRTAQELQRAGTPLLVSAQGAWRISGFWTENAQLQLFAVWETAAGLTPDSAAAECLQKDGMGWLNPYGDLARDAWYYESFRTAHLENFYRAGTAAQPERTATRADFVGMLYRVCGAPRAAAGRRVFTDVCDGDADYAAACWAYDKGVVNGMDGAFNAAGTLTREQALTMLCRLAGGAAERGEDLAFADADEISDWARTAVAAGVKRGWVQGMPMGEDAFAFCPREELTIAQALTFACRAAQALKSK